MSTLPYDLLIQNARVVRPSTVSDSVEQADIAIKNGKVLRVAAGLNPSDAAQCHDANGMLAFPGAIDAHAHVGIYTPPYDDAPSESASAVSGGVTCILTYVRTGSLYLNMGGSWRNFWPKLMAVSEGRYYCDYGYHVSPIEHGQLAEMDYMATECGAPNFGEVFMFYGLHGLHGRSDSQSKWLMLNEGDHYDLAHFDFICREAARLQRQHPNLAKYIQVSWHCETPEILRAYEPKIRAEGKLQGLEAYSAARPPHSEAIAINIVGSMAHAAGLKQVNILHITSREAMDAAIAMRTAYPDVEFGFEVTAGHLLLDYTSPCGVWGKVNPPLRSPADREYLWQRVLDGTLQWAMTDHASCPTEQKVSATNPDDIWHAKAGFGGTEFLLPGLFSEGTKRGLSANRIADLVSGAPARRFGCTSKGDIAEGFDADIVLLDPNERWTIRGADSFSNQGYTPFEGIEVTGRVKHTFVRGMHVFGDGKVIGDMRGQYVRRPN